jgi:hypothetical protein
MDKTSPEHRGYQVYSNPSRASAVFLAGLVIVNWTSGMLTHRKGESSITKEQLEESVDLLRQEYGRTYGQDRLRRAMYPRSAQRWTTGARDPSDPLICPQGKRKNVQLLL